MKFITDLAGNRLLPKTLIRNACALSINGGSDTVYQPDLRCTLYFSIAISVDQI